MVSGVEPCLWHHLQGSHHRSIYKFFLREKRHDDSRMRASWFDTLATNGAFAMKEEGASVCPERVEDACSGQLCFLEQINRLPAQMLMIRLKRGIHFVRFFFGHILPRPAKALLALLILRV